MAKNLLIALLILLAGCAGARMPEAPIPAETAVSAEDGNQAGEALLRSAEKALGSRYRSGGERPGSFDCSGLVKWAAKNCGLELPRTAAEQSGCGFPVNPQEELKAGDLLVFRLKRGLHVGIYAGNGNFIHSSSKYDAVRYARLDNPYFAPIYAGARRLIKNRP